MTNKMSPGDWGHVRRWYEEFVWEERVAGRNYGSAYQHELDQLGIHDLCGPGDHDKAALRVIQIDRIIEQGSWTKKENGRLWAMRKRWQARAEGKSPYFERYGTYSPRKGQISPSAAQEACPPQCFMCWMLRPTRYPGKSMWDALIRETDEKCSRIWI